MIKAVIFDYGEVIEVRRDPFFHYFHGVFDVSKKEIDYIISSTKDIYIAFNKGTINENDFWQKHSELLNKPLPSNFKEIARNTYKKAFIFNEKVVELAKELKAKGFKTAILSNMMPFMVEVIREKSLLSESFDEVLFSCEYKMRKPEKEFYLLALKKLSLKPEECIFIDDKKENLITAEKLKIKTILAKNQQQIAKDVMEIINSN